MFWGQSPQVRNMKLLVMLCFIAFHIETLRCGSEKSCKWLRPQLPHKKFPSLCNSQSVARKYKMILARLKGRAIEHGSFRSCRSTAWMWLQSTLPDMQKCEK